MTSAKPPLLRANPFDTPEAAREYQRWWGSPLGEVVFHAELATLLDLLPSQPARGLDLGCGTGNFTVAVARSGYQMIGVDASQAMLEVARKEAWNLQPPIAWVHAEMEALPFETSEFDFVFQLASLEFARNPGAALREVARVLRREGQYILGLVSHQSLFGLLKPSRRRKIPEIDLAIFQAELQGLQLERERQDIFLPPWNVPSIRRWGAWFERLGSRVGHGGALLVCQFRRV